MSDTMRAAVARSLANNPGARIQNVIDSLDEARRLFGLAHRTGDAAKQAQLMEWIDELERGVGPIVTHGRELFAPTRAVGKPVADVAHSLAIAVERFARATGAAMCRVETLHMNVGLYADESDRPYWQKIDAPKLIGLLWHTPHVRDLLASRGILVWFDLRDQRFRIVDSNWLIAHGDIYRFVTSPPLRGKRCRFDRLEETALSTDLVPVDPEARNPLTLRDGVPVLQPTVIYAHSRCRPHWLGWLEIAERYRSQEDADAADAAAGRQPARVPDAPTSEPDPPPPELGPEYTVHPPSNHENQYPTPTATARGRRRR